MRAQIAAGKLSDADAEKVPMLQRLLKYRYSSTNQLMPDNDIISESMGHMYVHNYLRNCEASVLIVFISSNPL